jgi:hypothetical protein
MREVPLLADPLKPQAQRATGDGLLRCFGSGIIAYLLTSAVVGLGILVGQTLLKPGHHRRPERRDAIAAFAAWDGDRAGRIVVEGYNYDPQGRSRVVILPLYPLLGYLLAPLTGGDPLLALLLISHLCLLGAFGFMACYVQQRWPLAPAALTDYTLLVMGLFPPTLFFRMVYTESLFLLLMILALYGMVRKWPLICIAAIAGLATGTRVVGLALLVPLVFHVWQQSPAWSSRLIRLALLIPLACLGIIGFMLYTWMTFREPLAFVEAQNWWRERPVAPPGQKLIDLATLEPLWSSLQPDSKLYWVRREDAGLGLFSYGLMEPFFFVASVALVGLGAVKRWLSGYEVLLAAGLLLSPYVSRGHEMGMVCSARYASVVFPVYLTLGQLLTRIRLLGAVGVLVLCGFLLGTYSAMFTTWYRVF